MKRCLLLCIFSSVLYSNPQNMTVVQGGAHVFENQSNLEVHVSDGAVLNWESFSIKAGETTQFFQPSSQAAVLNRVVGSEISTLSGILQANGKVYLINPNGILIGKEAVINTAAFIASTLDTSTEEFANSESLHFLGDSKASVQNLGTIVTPSGPTVLLAHKVDNQGSVKAAHISMGAGHEFYLQTEGQTELYIRPDMPAGGLDNEGVLEAVIIQLQADGTSSFAINQKGICQANTVAQEGGKIFLKAEGNICFDKENLIRAPDGEVAIQAKEVFYLGEIDVSGEKGGQISLEATYIYHDGIFKVDGPQGAIHIDLDQGFVGTQGSCLSAKGGGSIAIYSQANLFSSGTFEVSGEKGGNIALFSDKIALCAAHLNANGEKAGGTIFVGGKERGEAHAYPNAQKVTINPATLISANGEEGGRVILWSEDRMDFQGTISAKHGFVEVSGNELTRVGCVDADHLLLDPNNVTIAVTNGNYPGFQFVDPNAGSGTGFGTQILALPNGNIVVTKPENGATSTGAVYLYNGANGALINTVSGSNANDRVGAVFQLSGSNTNNYVIASPDWNGNLGAVTFVNGSTGLSAIVSSSNSLVGGTAGDQISSGGITALTNGNYVVISPLASPALIVQPNVGAVTWGNGSTGTTGTVGTSNSICGVTMNDNIGSGGVTALTGGDYVIASPSWHNGALIGAGAATWASGTATTLEQVTSANSIVGSAANDAVASGGVVALTNGDYVVVSPSWNNGATTEVGAVTWGSGTSVTGSVSTANSIVGVTANDQVGSGGVVALANGDYVISSPLWDNGGIVNAGAVTWANGTTTVSATVGTGNSIYGTASNDEVGSGGVVALTNNNYVILSPVWANGATTNAGAATWAPGGVSSSSPVSTGNSIYGTQSGDKVSSGGITALTNGNYVISSPLWGNGATTELGAATWATGSMSTSAAVSAANSLIGSSASDQVSSSGIVALTNGNYVVGSDTWSGNTGAVTLGNGTSGITGTVSTANSVTGQIGGDRVGYKIYAFSDGSYAVSSPYFDGSFGAATYFNGSTVQETTVNAGNSTLGTGGGNLSTIVKSIANGIYVASFLSDQVVSGIPYPNNNPLLASTFSGVDMTISPGYITTLVNAGTNVSIAAEGNITIQDTIAFTPTGAAATFTLNAGANLNIDANVTTTGSTSYSFTAGYNLNVGATVQTINGNILLIAGTNVNGTVAGATVEATGTGSVTLVADNANSTAPSIGTGVINFPSTSTISTAGGNVQLYSSTATNSLYPSTINGAIVPGTYVTQGVWYPNGTGGVPFAIFYKANSPGNVQQAIAATNSSVAGTLNNTNIQNVLNQNSTRNPNGIQTTNPAPCQ